MTNKHKPLTSLAYLRESAQETLQRELPVTYDEMPYNWSKLRVVGILRHLNRVHYSEWPDDLKMCVDDHLGILQG